MAASARLYLRVSPQFASSLGAEALKRRTTKQAVCLGIVADHFGVLKSCIRSRGRPWKLGPDSSKKQNSNESQPSLSPLPSFQSPQGFRRLRNCANLDTGSSSERATFRAKSQATESEKRYLIEIR